MKVLAGLLTSLVLALGLTVAPAQAYGPKSVATTCAATKVGATVYRYKFKAGTVNPKATVYVRVKNSHGVIVKRFRFVYSAPRRVRVGPLRHGSYRVTFAAVTGRTSIYKNCTVVKRLWVA